MTASATRVCVIGGGVAGLAACRALVARGVDARVREASPRAGGVIGSSRVDGFLREHAASSFLGGPARGGLATCTELGVPVERASEAAKSRWIFIDGKLRALPQSPVAFVKSDLLTWRGKLDLLREPLRPGRARGHDESMFDFAARRFGPEAARAIIAPFVTGIFADDAHLVSLEAAFPKLAALDDDGGMVRGMIKRAIAGRRARANGAEAAAPKPTPKGMWAPAGGLGTLIDALAASLGDRVVLADPVEAIAPAPAGVAGVLVDDELYDAAVLAIPAADAIPLVGPAMPELATRLGAFERAPVALVYLGYPADRVPAAADGFGALIAQGEAVRALGIVFESTVWSGRAPKGHALLRCIFGGGRDPSACQLDDAALIAQARADIATVLGDAGAPVHASVVRWAHGLARYPLGHREQVEAASLAARGRRVILAGADYRGPGVNDLCADAELVADEIARL